MQPPTADSQPLEAALAYLKDGWFSVPCPQNSKGPIIERWQDLRITEADAKNYFRGACNIGLLTGRPSNGLIDIDLDSPDAAQLAPVFLPPTLMSGREGNPKSHYWYIADPPPSYWVAYDLGKGKYRQTILEIRSDGHQTLVAPSRHPEGDCYRWENDAVPIVIDAKEITACVLDLATACLVHAHWNKGARQHMALALAGFLGRRLPFGRIERILKAVVSGDEQFSERLKSLKDTLKKLSTGKSVTGAPTLDSIVPGLGTRLADWWTDPPEIDIKSPATPEASLPSAIRKIANGTDKAFDRRRLISDLIRQHLENSGKLYRTVDGRSFYFHELEKRLYEIGQSRFDQLIVDLSGLSKTEDYFRFLLDTLAANVSRHSPLVEVSTLSVYRPQTRTLALSDGSNGIWFYRNGQWEHGHNGHDGILFLTEPDSVPWIPDFTQDGKALEWFLSKFNFSDDVLRAQDQRDLMRVWLLSVLFKTIQATKPIPTFLGPQGSGKTTAARLNGRLFQGPQFNVSGLRDDKEDAFIASVTNRVIYAVDNADSRIKWLEDALARYATGETHRIRKLYTTNEEVSYKAQAVLMLTSRDPQFRRPDVAERLLPFTLTRLSQFQDEPSLFGELEDRRPAILGDLLQLTGEALEALEAVEPPKLVFRMADFATFGWRIYKHQGAPDKWESLLSRLEKVQTNFASEGESLIEILRRFLDGGFFGPIETGELYRKCKEIANQEDLPFPQGSPAFGRRFWASQRVIEIELGVKILTELGHAGKKIVSFKKVSNSSSPASPTQPNGDDGDGGDDVSVNVIECLKKAGFHNPRIREVRP